MGLATSLSLARWQWITIAALYVVTLFWGYAAAGEVTFKMAACLLSILLGSFWAGDIVVRRVLGSPDRLNNLSARLAVGALLVSVMLYVFELVLPFGLSIDWLIILAIFFFAWFGTGGSKLQVIPRAECFPEHIFLVAAPILVTVWCRDLLWPLQISGSTVIIRAWQDVYYHLCQISAFANSSGLGSLSDVGMVGASVMPYHMGSYMLPALISAVAKTSALESYASFLVPFGLLLSGLGAYALAYSVFGRWPALVAGLAVLLLPDAFQQGFGNKFLGDYYWLQLIAPDGTYGVACAAVAFLLMLEGCRVHSYRLIAAGYLFALFVLIFKAQIFVAVSFPAFVFPVLFMRPLAARYRWALLLLFAAVYVSVVAFSQRLPGIPLMHLDGSGLDWYSTLILSNQSAGVIKSAVEFALSAAGSVWFLKAAVFSVLLILCTFGLCALVYICLIGKLTKHFDVSVWLFPVLVGAIYIVMAAGLAPDNRHIGTPEELLHRPFVWAYFVSVVWCTAAAYYLMVGDSAPTTSLGKWLLGAAACITLFLAPVRFSPGIQTYPGWGIEYQALPLCKFRAAEYIEAHSGTRDIIQDSLDDPHFTLSALSERRSFAIDTGGVRTPVGLAERLAVLKKLKDEADPVVVESYMKQNAINWYVAEPDDDIRWAESLRSRLAFGCEGIGVYRF